MSPNTATAIEIVKGEGTRLEKIRKIATQCNMPPSMAKTYYDMAVYHINKKDNKN